MMVHPWFLNMLSVYLSSAYCFVLRSAIYSAYILAYVFICFVRLRKIKYK